LGANKETRPHSAKVKALLMFVLQVTTSTALIGFLK
jgi:hypothetical protein